MTRHRVQQQVAGIGPNGQRRIGESRILLVGVGALGCQLADTFVRAGVGELLLFDRDVVAMDNLARQTLYTEDDARRGRPKAAAAADRLRSIDSEVTVTARSSEFDASAAATLPPVDLVLDGTDNFPTRFILNDFAISQGVPFLYGGVVGSQGRAQCVVPSQTPCLRCLLPEPPAGFEVENCATAGVLLPAVAAVAAFQAGQGLRWLSSDPRQPRSLCRGVFSCDVFTGEHGLRLGDVEPDSQCPSCGTGALPSLDPANRRDAVALCGRDAVQIRPPVGTSIDLDRLASRWREHQSGEVQSTDHMLRMDTGTFRLSVFADGRALVFGTEDLEQAARLYDTLVGSP